MVAVVAGLAAAVLYEHVPAKGQDCFQDLDQRLRLHAGAKRSCGARVGIGVALV